MAPDLRAALIAAAGLFVSGCGTSGATALDAPVVQDVRPFADGAGASDAVSADAPPDAAIADAPGDPTPIASDAAVDLTITPDASEDDSSAMRCNGHAALCDRRFDQVVFPTAHNAMSNADDNWVFPDQTHPIARQLEDGIRGLLIDTYSYLGGSYLCHTSCLLGNKKLVDALSDMVAFLKSHPNEVLMLDIEDHLAAADTEKAFMDSGLAAYVHVQAPDAPWPTLRAMIAAGHRVVVGAENGGPPPAWYHHFYDLAWDTPYTFKTPADFSCAQNRGLRTHALFLLNHWLENPVPDQTLSQTANAHDLLLGRARQCQMESGKLPNFVAVNHYSVGDLFQVVRELNGVN